MDSRIIAQNEITKLVHSCDYHEVEYDSHTGLAEQVEECVDPQSVYVNETSTRIERSDSGRAMTNRVSEWTVSASVRFSEEVAYFDGIRDVFIDRVPTIYLDKLYQINLKSMRHKHPPRSGGSNNGTIIDLVFSIDPLV